MRSRLRQVGGTLTIESEPGDGTAISAAVPLVRLAAETASAGASAGASTPAVAEAVTG